jgi:hypothetical protein
MSARSKASSFMCGFGRAREHIEHSMRSKNLFKEARILSMPTKEEFIQKLKQHAK